MKIPGINGMVTQRIQTSSSSWYASHSGINSTAQQGTQATTVQLTTSASSSKNQISLTVATIALHYTNGSMESVFSKLVVTANHTSNIQTLVKSVTTVLSSFRSYQNGTTSMSMTLGEEMLPPSTRKIALSTKSISTQISRFDRSYTTSKILSTFRPAEKQRYNVSSSNNTAAMSYQQSISGTQAIFSPIISKATSAFSASHVVNNVEMSKGNAFVSASSLNVQVKTLSTRSIPFIQRKTTQVVSSSKTAKTTAFSGRSASRTSVLVPLYSISKETSIAKYATVITRVIGSSKVSIAQTSNWQFSSTKDPANVSSRDRISESPSETLLRSGTMIPASLQASNANVSTIGSTFVMPLFIENASGHQSETSSVDVQPSLPGTSFIATTPLATESAKGLLESLEQTFLTFSSPSSDRTGDYINLLSTEQKPAQVASSSSKDHAISNSMLDNITTVQSSLVENSLNLITTPSTKASGYYRQEQTSAVFPSRPKSVGYTSAATYSLSKVGGHSSENYNVVSTPVIFNSPFLTDSVGSSLLATDPVCSFRITMQYSSQVKLERTPSPSEGTWTEYVPFTSASPKATLRSMIAKGITSTRSSPLDSSLKYSPIMESMTSRLPSTVSTHRSAVLKRRTFISTLSQGPSATYIDSSLLAPSLHIFLNSGVSTGPLTDVSSIENASVKKGILVSSSAFKELSPFTTVTSSTKTTVKLPRHNVSTSASIAVVSLRSQTITGSTMATSVSLKNSYTAHAGLVSSLGTKQPTFSPSSEERVTTIQTQTLTRSPSRSSTALNATPSMTLSPASSALITVQTRPVPENPKQFEGRMILQIPWNPQYQIAYTPEFQELAFRIMKELTEVLKTLENFLSVQVLRLWKSSVGVDFVVFMRQNAQISGGALEQTLIGANRTGVLDLPITNLHVKEPIGTTTAPSAPTPDEHKSLERWEIVLIASGILVFLLLLITCILAVSNYHIYLCCLSVDRTHLKHMPALNFRPF